VVETCLQGLCGHDSQRRQQDSANWLRRYDNAATYAMRVIP